ncbi:hypothetical protein CP965_04990 [Halarcobacter mediterraneus]|uniref:Uncharacterized protein n=1 Tax=Halarcobacter mediterraneus TaxID=2023153 RepID=A0A4Q1B4K3_9BACT|nr:hypothetical protein [Halarcobacter mediterraneus]RXK13157.1 hypothetical protein CP965_04990 [Halarcobacter mediterraneus]
MNNNTSVVESKGFLYYFDRVTSNNGKDWFLALTWIFVFEIISSIIEYEYLSVARTYIVDIPEGVLKEFIIAIFVSFFVWHFVFSIVNMRRNQFYFLILYGLLGLYFYITKDVTFNLLFHNIINPFELQFNGFGPYTLVQLFIKLIILYLIFKMLQGIKNRKERV